MSKRFAIVSYIKSFLLIVVLGSLFTACSDGKLKGPTEKSVENSLAYEVANYISIKNFEVQAVENIGSEVDPVFRARFSADGHTTEPLYSETETLMGMFILKETTPKNTPIRLSGKYQAELDGERWEIYFQNISSSPSPSGSPLSNWSSGSYVFVDTKQETELRAKAKAAKDKAEADKKAAIEKKKRDAAERKRQAQLKANRQAAASKAQDKAFRKSLVGTWLTTGYVLDKRGNVYSVYGTPKQCGVSKFKLSIPESNTNSIPAKLTIVIEGNEKLNKTVDAHLLVNSTNRSMSMTISKFNIVCKYTKGPATLGGRPIALSRSQDREDDVFRAVGKPWKGTVKDGEVKLIDTYKRNVTLRKS